MVRVQFLFFLCRPSKARVKRRTSHKPNPIQAIELMGSSAFDPIKFDWFYMILFGEAEARVKRRTSHEQNRMQMEDPLLSPISIRFGSCEVQCLIRACGRFSLPRRERPLLAGKLLKTPEDRLWVRRRPSHEPNQTHNQGSKGAILTLPWTPETISDSAECNV